MASGVSVSRLLAVSAWGGPAASLFVFFAGVAGAVAGGALVGGFVVCAFLSFWCGGEGWVLPAFLVEPGVGVGDVFGVGVVSFPLLGGCGCCFDDGGCVGCGVFVPPLFAFFAGDFAGVDVPERVERGVVYWLWFYGYGYLVTSGRGYSHQR